MSDVPELQALTPCTCTNMRMATRSLTHYYDDALRPENIRITQYALLSAISEHERHSIGEIAKTMGIDQSTATRNIEILIREGYIDSVTDENDSRIKHLSVSSAGKAKIEQTQPLWKKAQAEIKKKFGSAEYAQLVTLLAKLRTL